MQGKVVVITGALGVLGAATAAEARALGARVASVDVAKAGASGDDLYFGGIDLTESAAAEQVVAAIRGKAGRIDALLNIAGGFTWRPVAEAEPALWERMFALNLKTCVNASRAALPHLQESNGAIVNVGAASALKAAAGMGPYGASKSGVHKLTEALAEEQKGKVRVNAVLPSILDTPQNRKDMPDVDPSKWVQPSDLAKVILFLASEQARAVTGALVPVTGKV